MGKLLGNWLLHGWLATDMGIPKKTDVGIPTWNF